MPVPGAREQSTGEMVEPEPIAPNLDEPLDASKHKLLKRFRRIEALLAIWGPGPRIGTLPSKIQAALVRPEGASSEWKGALATATAK